MIAEDAPEGAGDTWTWTAIDADSKLIGSYLAGGRDAEYAWEFEKAGRSLNVHVPGQLIVNEIAIARQAAHDGSGLAYLPENTSAPTLRLAS